MYIKGMKCSHRELSMIVDAIKSHDLQTCCKSYLNAEHKKLYDAQCRNIGRMVIEAMAPWRGRLEETNRIYTETSLTAVEGGGVETNVELKRKED